MSYSARDPGKSQQSHLIRNKVKIAAISPAFSLCSGKLYRFNYALCKWGDFF